MKTNLSKYIALIVFALVSALSLSAQSVSLKVNRQVVQGNRFTVTIRVTNGEGRVSKDQAPKLSGCTLLFGPATSTMHSVQIINGRQSSSMSTDYSFTYQADKAGQVSIPAITVNVDGKNLSTQPATITILPPTSRRVIKINITTPSRRCLGTVNSPSRLVKTTAVRQSRLRTL